MPSATDDTHIGHDAAFAVRWRNFRAFEDTGWVTLKPLTLLLGANSAGKSSFIAPLLLLEQSTDSRTGTNALLTRGYYLDVGVYEDFVRGGFSRRTLALSPPKRDHKKGGHVPPGGLIVSFGPGDDEQGVVVRSYSVEDTHRRIMFTRLLQSDGSYSLRMARGPTSPTRPRRRQRAIVERRKAMREASRMPRLSTSSS